MPGIKEILGRPEMIIIMIVKDENEDLMILATEKEEQKCIYICWWPVTALHMMLFVVMSLTTNKLELAVSAWK